ncbi:MAG: ABC transporter permease subunit [Planctomycetota bacterium]
MPRSSWLTVTSGLSAKRSAPLIVASFILPMAVWCLVSYVPFIWHPLVNVQVSGSSIYRIGDRPEKADFRREREEALADNNAIREQLTTSGPLDARPSRVKRANKAVVKQFGPYAEANGWLDARAALDERAIFGAMTSYLAGELEPTQARLSAENIEVVQHNVGVLAELQADDARKLALPGDRYLLSLIPQGRPENPVFLPPPHEVGLAFYDAFVTPPRREGEPWLHERLGESIATIARGFGLACLIGLPLGLICGAFPFFAKLTEPVVNFVSYIPPPAFGALLIAVFGIAGGPKIAMVFIAAVFPLVLMVAKTTRLMEPALLEAAQTLGASRSRLVTRVIVPGVLPNVWNDLRIVLALSWTILIIAELTGTKSGISGYMQQQGRYRNFDNVFAAMVMIGIIGFAVDQLLVLARRVFFPWAYGGPLNLGKGLAAVWGRVTGFLPATAPPSSDREPSRSPADATAV